MPTSLYATVAPRALLLIVIILICPVWNIQAALSVGLAWDPASNAAGYYLSAGTTSGVYLQTIAVGNTMTTLVSNLVAGQKYFFAVTAYDASGVESAPSNEVSYTASTSTPTPTPIPLPTLSGMTVVTASNGVPFAPFTNGYTYNSIYALSVRADPISEVASVLFKLDGVLIHTESAPPYSVAGDTVTSYTVWRPTVGNHTLTATPYSAASGTGTAGSAITITFTVL